MRRRVGLQPPAHFEPVHVGHHHVEQDEVAFGALADGQGLGPAHGRDDVEIFGRQPRFEQLDVGRNIVDDENPSGHSLVLRIAQKMSDGLDELAHRDRLTR